ncbi:hypothetical protein BH18VER1_BH18VER1_17940 [soil metagenome]
MPETVRYAIGERARAQVLAAHTAAHRAAEMVAFFNESRYLNAENRKLWVMKE